MADSYIDNNSGSKKKYLIPLVVLMICAVSLTGAGYAYSNNAATMEVDNNDLDAEYLSIDFSSSTSASAYYTANAAELVDFYDHIVYSKSGSTISDTHAVSWAPADSAIVTDDSTGNTKAILADTLNLTISQGDADKNGDTATSEMQAAFLSVNLSNSVTTIEPVEGKTIALSKIIPSYSVKVTVGGASTTQTYNTYGTDLIFAITTTADTATDVTVEIYFNVLNGKAVDSDNKDVDFEKAVAKLCNDKFDAITYGITLTCWESGATSMGTAATTYNVYTASA